jgi:signal transduction histidine kinase
MAMNKGNTFLGILTLPIFRQANQGGEVEEIQTVQKPARRAKRVIRRYQGLAGRMRRQVVIGVALGLLIGEFGIVVGYTLNARQSLDYEQEFVFVAMIAMAGIMAGGLLTLRLMAMSLDSIERVEASMKQMASAENHKAIKAVIHEEDGSNPLIGAYNLLVDHLDEIETQNLEFLGKITHDIRSPLASVMGYAELLGDPDLRKDGLFLDKCQRTITKEGQQIATLVEDAFLTAGLDNGRYEVTLLPFHLERLVEEISQEVGQRYKREIQWQNRVGEAVVLGDPIGMREAIQKLVINAVKYSPAGEPVIVMLECAEKPDRVMIHVKDQGIGIDELGKAMLFRRFGRIRNDATRGINGTGLGLYIAKNIISQHNGEIYVESEPGEGSTFTVLLPLAKAYQPLEN